MRANKKIVALGAACVSLAFAVSVVAQDDLNDLLDLDTKAPAKKAEVKQATPAKPAEAKPATAPKPAAAQPAAKPAAPAPAAAAEKKPEVKPAAPAPAAAAEKKPEVKPAAPAPAAVAEKKPAAPAVGLEALAPAEAAAKKPVAKAAEPAHPDAALIADLMGVEELRRSSLDLQAKREMDAANAAMINRDWDNMYKQYSLALRHLNDRADSVADRKKCMEMMAEAKYQAAKQALRESDREHGMELAKEAMKLHHPNAGALLAALEAESVQDNETDRSDTEHVRNTPEYKKDRDLIQKRLRLSSQYLALSDLTRSLDQCDLVLRSDPYNQEAIALRERIQRKRQIIIERERVSARNGMIADVDAAWRPVYAINSPELKAIDGGTSKTKAGMNDERSIEQSIEKRMKEMILPAISFRPPATIIDAVDFFRQASKDFDKPEIPVDQRGFNFVLQLEKTLTGGAGGNAQGKGNQDAFSAASDEENGGAQGDVPQIPNISASNISLWEALKLVCKVSQFKFKVQGSVVMVMPKSMSTDELVTRTYSVVESFLERVTDASSGLRKEKTGDFGGGDNNAAGEGGSDDENQWKAYFEEMGVNWPQNSRIKYIKAVGKLRVTNTEDQLAVFEDALNELNVTPSMIEIETRFVEVAQEDLNSLGFEWLLNSDYTFNVGGKIKKALNMKDGSQYDTSKWILVNGERQDVSDATFGTTTTQTLTENSTFGQNGNLTGYSQSQGLVTTSTSYDPNNIPGTTSSTKDYKWVDGAGWVRGNPESGGTRTGKNALINAMDGTTYQSGMRYLSTSGNPVAGDALSMNDKFMRLNAFLGNADLSMVLHMLSQRSDTDLLSAPKVVTKSGQEATIKVVTIYRFPQDYDVTIQSTSSGSSGGYYGNSGGSSGKILPMVEPQNFETQEVGVILTVTPDLSPEGLINLQLTPKIVSEPEWRDYGMKVPMDAVMGDTSIVTSSLDGVQNLATSKSADDIQWFSVPMEQPFFKERSIDTHVTLYNGATIVMGGLITEERRSMEDKIPFLGDIPFIGRIFRSRSEWSNKRNLLIFVTARLVDPNGRQIIQNVSDKVEPTAADAAQVTPAPAAN